jgi:hypothetical protein
MTEKRSSTFIRIKGKARELGKAIATERTSYFFFLQISMNA